MARAIGIGGIFIKGQDQEGLRKWYADLLGLELQPWGGALMFPQDMVDHPGSATVFNVFEPSTDYMDPSTEKVMINFAVDDLDGILARANEMGIEVNELPEQFNGRFAHLMDPEGTKIELWQPKPFQPQD